MDLRLGRSISSDGALLDCDLDLKYTLGATIDIEKGAVGTYTSAYAYTDNTASSLSVKYNFTVTLAGGMETYFDASVATPEGLTLEGGTYNVTYAADVVESKDFAITLAWKTDKEPATLAEYKTMNADLKDGGQINIAASVDSAVKKTRPAPSTLMDGGAGFIRLLKKYFHIS